MKVHSKFNQLLTEILKLRPMSDDSVTGIAYSRTTLKYRVVGNVIYTVEKIRSINKHNQQIRNSTIIVVYEIMFEDDGKGGRKYRYEKCQEVMGPLHYECPKEFFDIAPVTNEEWREWCVRHQQEAVGVA